MYAHFIVATLFIKYISPKFSKDNGKSKLINFYKLIIYVYGQRWSLAEMRDIVTHYWTK